MLFVLTRYAPTDPVFAMGRLMISIQRDMVMLENQIPLFVLEKFDRATARHSVPTRFGGTTSS